MNGIKYDEGKIRYDLIPPFSLQQLAKVYTEGAKKYKENNWKKVKNGKQRYLSALFRHLEKYRAGEIINEEDFDLHHMAHVAWCAFAIMFFDEKNIKRRKKK